MSEGGGEDQIDSGEQSQTLSTVADRSQSKRLKKKKKKPAPLARGAALGRYIVLDTLGEGGMGLVYKAYDPELDRQIAVKLVRVRGRHKQAAQERLLREAQALAQLSHPNVIAVFDVGTFGGDVFIAMELVDGEDARAWLRKDHSRAETMQLFLSAGRGLDAAHDAGLVHRDFKPDNIVIGNDGRARVIDFGLARGAGTADAEFDMESSGVSQSDSQTSSTGKKRLNTPLTQVGSVVGTPAYMAPEQHKGEEVDARSDQFSFCVSLYRALYGVRPFTGDSPTELTANVTEGRLSPPPRHPKVPRWIRRILLRGLSVNPEERYQSMGALLAELQRDPAIQRNRILRTAGFAGVVAVAAYSLTRGTQKEPLCQDGNAQLAGVWDGPLRTSTKAAFTATKRSHAAATFDLVDQRLTHYAQGWVQMYTDSCKATNVRAVQSEALLDLRTQCLSRQRGKMAALTSLMSKTEDPLLVDRAVSAVIGLPAVDICADERALTSAIPLPIDDKTKAAVEVARRSIDTAEAMTKAGDYQGALELASNIARSVDHLNYAPVQAEALLLLGSNQRRRRQSEEAEATLYEATLKAAEAQDDVLAAKAWLELLWVIGYSKAKPDEALKIRRLVEPAVVRSGSERLYGDLMNNLGAILRRKGKYPEAKEHLERAIEIWTRTRGKDSLQVAKAHNNLGNVLNDTHEYLDARKHHERVLEIRSAVLGKDHPYIASTLNNLGNSFMEQEKYALARDYYQRSLDIALKVDPAGEEAVLALNNLGNATSELGDLAKAQRIQERSLAIQMESGNPESADMGITVNNLADVFLKQKKFVSAKQHYERSRDIWIRTLHSEHTYVGHASVGIGQALLGLEEPAEARAHYRKALEIWTKAHGPKHAMVAIAQEGLATCALQEGNSAEAIKLFEQVVEIHEAAADVLKLAMTRAALARALWSSGKKAVALALAQDALSQIKEMPKPSQDEITNLQAWLSTHTMP